MPMTVVGFIFLGAMEAFIFVPLMPVLIDALKTNDHIELEEEDESLSDQASSLFQAAQAVGCIFGPIVGGVLNDMVRFQSTCDIMAVTCMIYAAGLYLVMMDGWSKVVARVKEVLKKQIGG